MDDKLVLLESPYRGRDYAKLELNIAYGRACMRDCLLRGEFPFASHLLYTQEGVLSDKDKNERELGIQAGWAWGRHADVTAVYCDIIEVNAADDWNWYIGIARGVKAAHEAGRPVEFRNLPDEVLQQLDPTIIQKRKCAEDIHESLKVFLRKELAR